eukprot:sb/3472979/
MSHLFSPSVSLSSTTQIVNSTNSNISHSPIIPPSPSSSGANCVLTTINLPSVLTTNISHHPPTILFTLNKSLMGILPVSLGSTRNNNRAASPQHTIVCGLSLFRCLTDSWNNSSGFNDTPSPHFTHFSVVRATGSLRGTNWVHPVHVNLLNEGKLSGV